MKQVGNEDLPNIQGGADSSTVAGDTTLPYPLAPATITTTISDGSQLPPILPDKHVEV